MDSAQNTVTTMNLVGGDDNEPIVRRDSSLLLIASTTGADHGGGGVASHHSSRSPSPAPSPLPVGPIETSEDPIQDEEHDHHNNGSPFSSPVGAGGHQSSSDNSLATTADGSASVARGSIATSVYALAATALGAGTLGMPYAFANLGLILGIICMISYVALSIYSLHLMVTLSEEGFAEMLLKKLREEKARNCCTPAKGNQGVVDDKRTITDSAEKDDENDAVVPVTTTIEIQVEAASPVLASASTAARLHDDQDCQHLSVSASTASLNSGEAVYAAKKGKDELSCEIEPTQPILLGISTYETLALHYGGVWLKRAVALFMVSVSWGITVVYVSVIQQLLTPIHEKIAENSSFPSGVWGVRLIVFLFWLCIMLPLSLLRTMTMLQIASAVSLFTAFLLSICATIHLAIDGAASLEDIESPTTFLKAVQGMANMKSGFGAQAAVMAVYRELSHRAPVRMFKAIMIANLGCALFYVYVGIIGALDFGRDVGDNLLGEYEDPLGKWYIIVAYLGMAVTITLSFPICIFPPRDTVLQIFGYQSALDAPTGLRILVGTIMAVISLVVGTFLPSLNLAFGVIGGVFGNLLSYVFPAVLALRSSWLWGESPSKVLKREMEKYSRDKHKSNELISEATTKVVGGDDSSANEPFPKNDKELTSREAKKTHLVGVLVLLIVGAVTGPLCTTVSLVLEFS